MRKGISNILTIILIVGLLMGFSQPDSSPLAKPDLTSINNASTADIKDILQQFNDEGAFKNKGVSQALQSHLANVEKDANRERWEKADKRIDKFIDFLNKKQKVGHITDQAYNTLLTQANALKIQWNTALDSDEVMQTIWDLSVEIGPRVLGEEGEKEAAAYLKNKFENYGYDDVSIQEFDVPDTTTRRLTINNDEELALGATTGSAETDENGVTGNLYDAGLGFPVDFTAEANGKIALIQRGDLSYWDKVKNAEEAGAAGVIIYNNADGLRPPNGSLSGNESSIPVVTIQKADGETLLTQMNEDAVEANLYIKGNTNQTSQNVIAVKKPKDVTNPEIVYITGHYDSVPFSPGANDDASGTAVVMELSRIMKDIPTDKEIRFIAFGAEEGGYIGSRHYVNQLSQEEIDRSAANFQMEMMGAKYEPGSYLAYNTVDGKKNLIWDYTDAAFDNLGYDKEKLILFRRGSSDHVPFHNVGITAACFNMGTKGGGLEPEYHTSHDTYENVSQERVNFSGQVVKNAIFHYLADQASAENDLQEAS